MPDIYVVNGDISMMILVWLVGVSVMAGLVWLGERVKKK